MGTIQSRTVSQDRRRECADGWLQVGCFLGEADPQVPTCKGSLDVFDIYPGAADGHDAVDIGSMFGDASDIDPRRCAGHFGGTVADRARPALSGEARFSARSLCMACLSDVSGWRPWPIGRADGGCHQ